MFLGISNFLEEISSLFHSIFFLYFFALITEVGFLISPCYSLELCNKMGISFFFSFAFGFSFSHLFVRLPQTAILLFCISFSWGWSWSLSPVQCYDPLSIVHQALCLSDLVQMIECDPLEKGMAIHSSTIAWRIPWTEEPGRLQSMGSQRVRHDWATSLLTI